MAASRLPAALLVALAVFAPAAASAQSAWGATFVDVAARAGITAPFVYGGRESKKYIVEANGSGVAFFDYDNDGWVDVFLTNGSTLEGFPAGKAPTAHLYHNERDGTFADVTAKAGLARAGWSNGVCVGDYDNDGFEDLFLTYWGQNALYRNDGDGTFADVTAKAGVATVGTRWGSGCTFVDVDRDGDLDLFVANYLKFDLATAKPPGSEAGCYWQGVPVNCGPKGLATDTCLLYRNNGDGTFADVSDASGVSKVKGRYAMTAVVTDFDDDGWPDVFVACDSTPSVLFKNGRDGTFSDVATEAGCAFSEDGRAQAGMGVATGDLDGNGTVDLFKTHFSDDLPALYRNTGKGYYDDASRASGFEITRYVEWGTLASDFDDDGLPDLMIATGSVYPEVEKTLKQYPARGPRLVYRNAGGGLFKDVTAASGTGATAPYSCRGLAAGDFDNDGDVDVLAMTMNDAPLLLRNDRAPGPAAHWLGVSLVGKKSNRSAIGARARVTAGGRSLTQEVTSQSSYYSASDRRLHFGLGAAAKVDAIEVRWPNGARETIKDVPANGYVTIVEGSGVAKPSATAPAKRGRG